jgi:type IV secretion system protein VirB10
MAWPSPSWARRCGRCKRRDAGDARELYNVDRVAKSEELDQLPADYSKLPPTPAANVPTLGPPLPGDLGPAVVNAQPPLPPNMPPGNDPAAAERDAIRKEAEDAAGSSVFFRSSSQHTAAAPVQTASAMPASALAGFDPHSAGPASTAAQPADPTAVQNRQDQKEAFQKAGTTETRNSGNLQMPTSPYQVMAGTVISAALVTGIRGTSR